MQKEWKKTYYNKKNTFLKIFIIIIILVIGALIFSQSPTHQRDLLCNDSFEYEISCERAVEIAKNSQNDFILDVISANAKNGIIINDVEYESVWEIETEIDSSELDYFDGNITIVSIDADNGILISTRYEQ